MEKERLSKSPFILPATKAPRWRFSSLQIYKTLHQKTETIRRQRGFLKGAAHPKINMMCFSSYLQVLFMYLDLFVVWVAEFGRSEH